MVEILNGWCLCALGSSESLQEIETVMSAENDIVLIYFEEKPLAFGRIEAILADHKPGWYHVRILLLQVPLQVVTWILRDAYIDGEPFTMNGKQMRLERVVAPALEEGGEESPDIQKPTKPTPKPTDAKVINLSDLKKK